MPINMILQLAGNQNLSKDKRVGSSTTTRRVKRYSLSIKNK